MKNYLLLILLTLSTASYTTELDVLSKTFEDGRRIWINLPANYNQTTMEYPVIYIFDGQILFNYLIGLYEYNFDKYPPAIIVGIEHIDRGNELIESKSHEAKEYYNRFNDFIKQNVIEYTDSVYRTNSIKIGVGHSHGGTFVLNRLLEKNTFNVGLCISPTLWTNEQIIFKKYKEAILNSTSEQQLYLGYGENDYNSIKNTVTKFYNVLKADSSLIKTQLEVYQNEDHNSAALIGIRKGLDFIFDDYIFPETKWDLIEKTGNDSIFYSHYEILSEKFNAQIIPSEDDLNTLGYSMLEFDNVDNALEVFETAIKNYPYSANVYDSYADALEQNGDLTESYRYCQKAINKEDNKYQLKQYQEHLLRIEKKMNK